MITKEKFESLFNPRTKVYAVYQVLKDQQWHCRECKYDHVGSSQIAGGSGIQGLQRGTQSRPGMVIDSANHLCMVCEKTTRQDRWRGGFNQPVLIASMPPAFAGRAVRLLGSRDVIEQTERPKGQLTVDHKLPMLRWNPETTPEQTCYAEMSDDDIRSRFQLLKRSNGSVSHNLLKSRACERCFKTGRRGTPFGILFFYNGGFKWEPSDKKDASGCVGCGWYDFDLWRNALNEYIKGHASQP